MRRHYIDKHCETNCGSDDSIPLHREILVFTSEQWNKLGQINLTNLRVNQQNDETLYIYNERLNMSNLLYSVDELNQEHLYDT